MKPYKSEDWIKCELYKRLTNIGLEVYPEMHFFSKLYSTTRGGMVRKVGIRADLAIYKNDELLILIEVKNHKSRTEPLKSGRQYKKYTSLGAPFVYCMNESQIEQTVLFVAGLIKK